MHPIRTLGHGTLTADALVRLLSEGGVEVVVDIRRYPGSRRHPHFGSAEMATWLPSRGLSYRWLPSLGGRRRPTAGSPNVGLRNEQFRAYADHMASEEFAEGVAELTELTVDQPVVIMCAESLWWRCHRRLLADHLVLVSGVPVEHVFHDGRLAEHHATAESRRADDHVVYDVGVDRPFLDGS